MLGPLDPSGVLVTFDAQHTVQANVTSLVEAKNAHYTAMIKSNQPTAYRQLAAPPRTDIAVQQTASSTGRGRQESRYIKTLGITDELRQIAFPHALRVHRHCKQSGRRETRETVYAVTSLDVHQTTRPNSQPPSAATGASKPSTTSETRPTPRTPPYRHHTPHRDHSTMASSRNLTGPPQTLGATNVTRTSLAIHNHPERALPLLGITNNPDT